MEYIINSIDKKKYCNSNYPIYVVHLTSDEKSNVVLELTIQGIDEDSKIKIIVDEFNNPLRIKNSYNFKPISEIQLNEDVVLFSTEYSKNGYLCGIKSANKANLNEFMEYVNNPKDVDVDFLIKEHAHLGELINNHSQIIQKLNNERQLIEYRIWTRVWRERNVDT